MEPEPGSLAALAVDQAAVLGEGNPTPGADALPAAPGAGSSAATPLQRMSPRGSCVAAAAWCTVWQWQEARLLAQAPGPSSQQALASPQAPLRQACAGQQHVAPDAASNDTQPDAGAQPIRVNAVQHRWMQLVWLLPGTCTITPAPVCKQMQSLHLFLHAAGPAEPLAVDGLSDATFCINPADLPGAPFHADTC